MLATRKAGITDQELATVAGLNESEISEIPIERWQTLAVNDAASTIRK